MFEGLLKRCAFSALATASLALPAMADSPPKQLYGKSISSSCMVDVVSKDSEGRQYRPQIRFDFLVYVSTAGRLFTRGTVSRGRLSSQGELDPGANRPGSPVQASWVGRRLVLSRAYISGAGQQAIDFGSDYRTCSANVLFGKRNGAPIVWKSPLTGQTYEVISSNVVSTNCAITDGNSLAQQ